MKTIIAAALAAAARADWLDAVATEGLIGCHKYTPMGSAWRCEGWVGHHGVEAPPAQEHHRQSKVEHAQANVDRIIARLRASQAANHD